MKAFLRTSFVLALLFTCFGLQHSNAQNDDRIPMRFGLLGGLNYNNVSLDTLGIFNFAPGTAQPLGVDAGSGLGGYFGLMYEYAPSMFGFHIRATYDNRSASFGDVDSSAVDASLAYLSLEPALRVELGSPELHLLVGPSLNLLISNGIDYTALGGLPISGEVVTASNTTWGLWGGLGYDIELSRNNANGTAWYLTPFVSAHWMPGQVDNEDQDWSTVTVRGGLQLKLGFGGKKNEARRDVPASSDGLSLAIRTPLGGVSEQRRLEEFLPLLNYMFFPEGETGIPNKYTKLSPAQAQSFNEQTMLDRAAPTTGAASSATRSQRQLDVYYNMLNILGARMRENPSSKISVVGASPKTDDAKKMAESVKSYLVSNFGVDPSRIETKGQTRPPHASGTRNTPKEDKDLITEENNRVEILTNDTKLLEPVKINARQEEPLENDLVFELNLTSATSVSNWNLTVEGTDNDFSQTYGPFYGKVARVNATPMLTDQDRGNFIASVDAASYDGGQLTTNGEFELQKKRMPLATGTRYSILFEYDDSKSVKTYDEFLRTEVAPRIPNGATVFIHGHTDVTGKDDYNAELSAKRAVEAQKVLEDELKKLGRDITFDAYGFGETQFRAPFANKAAEERNYNRTVMIEIIPES